MRRLGLIIGLWLGLLLAAAHAGSYALTDGTRVTGDPATYQEDGIVLKTADGSYTPLIPWGKFTDDALKQLQAAASTPRERAILEPLLQDLPSDKAKYREITVKPIQTPDRPTGHLGMLAILSSPLGWFILLMVYSANLFAAYEVARFRNQPMPTVCGLAAIPFFGVASSIFFLAMPTRGLPDDEPVSSIAHKPGKTYEPAAYAPPESSDETSAEAAVGVPATSGRQDSTKTAHGAPEPAPAALPAPIVFQRGDFSFNRRFFETKLAGFFRVVLSDADKDMVILIKASRGEFIGKRIPRITQSELYLQIFKEGATADEMIPFVEILEVQIRHKDLA